MEFTCKRCGTIFKAKHHLKQHFNRILVCEATHSNMSLKQLMELEFPKLQKPYKCKYCDKSFSQQPNRSRHQTECPYNTGKTDNNQNEDLVRELKSLKTHIQLLESTLRDKAQEEINAINHSDPPQQPPQQTTIKKNKSKIPQVKRIACWKKYIGDVLSTKCMCCNMTEITAFSFHCGHVVSEADGGALAIDNLRPICDKCNNDMGTENMFQFAKHHYDTILI
jgi:hypothetical protein